MPQRPARRRALPLEAYLLAIIVPPGYKAAMDSRAGAPVIEMPAWRGARDLAYRELVAGRADPELAAVLSRLRESASPEYPGAMLQAYREHLEAAPPAESRTRARLPQQ